MSEEASTPTSQMIRIPETLLADSYLLANSRLREPNGYSDLTSSLRSHLATAKLGITKGTESYLKRRRILGFALWAVLLSAVGVTYLAWSISWWWLGALLVCVLAFGRINYAQKETNKMLGAYLISVDRLLEEKHWQSTKEGLEAQALVNWANKKMNTSA